MSLRDFIKEMEKANEVVHVKDRVSTRFEISSIMKELDGGPILFFDDVKDHTTKIIANVCGTRKRICSALKANQGTLYKKIIDAWQKPLPPKIVKEGRVKDVVEKATLSKIPILTHFERDAGPYITSAIVSARSFDGKIENVSIHRLQVLDDNHLVIRLVQRQLYKLWEMAKEERRGLPVAIAFGLHPAVLLAAASSPSFGVNEFAIANSLLENGIRLTKCEHVNVCVPSDAEIVLEGVISTEKKTIEGPFVDITGTYDIRRSQPIIELVGVMRREDCMYQALLPSGMEHRLLMGLPRETIIWDAVTKVVPVVRAVNLSNGGCGWLHAIISIEEQTEGDGKNALLAALSAHPSLKHAVVVNTDVDVFSPEEVEWAIATRFQAERDLIIISDVRGSSLDPSADQETGLTTKLGIDATHPLTTPREKFELARIPITKKIVWITKKIRKSEAPLDRVQTTRSE